MKDLIQKFIAGFIVFNLIFTPAPCFAASTKESSVKPILQIAIPTKPVVTNTSSSTKIQGVQVFSEEPSPLNTPRSQTQDIKSPTTSLAAWGGGDFVRLTGNKFLISGLKPKEEGGGIFVAVVDSTGKVGRILYEDKNPQTKTIPKAAVSNNGQYVSILYSAASPDVFDKAMVYNPSTLTTNKPLKIDLPKIYSQSNQTQAGVGIAVSDIGAFFILGQGVERDPASSLQKKLGNFVLAYNKSGKLIFTSTIDISETSGLIDYSRMDLRLNNMREMLYVYGTTQPEWSKERVVPSVGIQRFLVKYTPAPSKNPFLEKQPLSVVYGAKGQTEMTPDGNYLIVNNTKTNEQWLIANGQIVFSRKGVQLLDTLPAHQSAASTTQGVFMFTHPADADGNKNPWLNLYDPKTNQTWYGDFSAILKASGFQKGSGKFTVTGQTLVNGARGKQNLVVLVSESMPQSSGSVNYRNFLASFSVNTLADFIKKDMHNALLQQINTQMKPAEEEINSVEPIMKKVNNWSEIVAPLGTDMRTQKNELYSILTELQNLKDDSRLSAQLRSDIVSFIDPAALARQGLDDAALTQIIDKFLVVYPMNIRFDKWDDPKERLGGQIKADYQNALKYQDDLLNYKQQVMGTSTPQAMSSLSAEFPIRKQTLFTPIQTLDPRFQLGAAVQKAGTLLNQAQDALSQENPVQFINRIASQLTTTFVGPDGQLTLKGLREIERAGNKFVSNSSAFPDSTKKVFENWNAASGFVALLKRYLNAPGGAGDKLMILDSLWSSREDSLNGILKNSVFSVLAAETLKTSSQAGVGSSGFSNIYNAPLAVLLVAVKKENRPEWLPKIRKYIEEKMERHSMETLDEFARRKAKVLKLFDDYKVVFNYSPKSMPAMPNLREINWFEMHLKYLDQISKLIAAKPPFMQELDLIEVNAALPRGIAAMASGIGRTRSFTVSPVSSPVLFLHEAMHIDAGEKGFPGWAPPRISEIFLEAAGSNNFVTDYHKNPAEAWAEFGAYMANDTVGEVLTNTAQPRLGALTRALNGHLLLLEQALEYERIYLNQPNVFVTSKLNPETGEITYGSLPIKRNEKNQIIELTLNNQTYHLDYLVSGRLKQVTV